MEATAPTEELRAEYGRIAKAMDECGNCLEFKVFRHPVTGKRVKRLVRANFCKARLCPMCNWRRSQKLGMELEQAVGEFRRRHVGCVPIMVTLTERNSTSVGLSESLEGMQAAFSKLRKRECFQRAVLGWFKSVEVSCPTGLYHPHVHLLLLMRAEYFDKQHDLYIPQVEWAQLWRECRDLDYKPVVDVRRVRRLGELTKYVTKTQDYLKWEGDERGWVGNTEVIRTLHHALRKRRLVAWSSELGKIREEFGHMDDDENEDLIGEDRAPPGFKAVGREIYKWFPSSLKRGTYRMVFSMPASEVSHE